MQYETKQSTLEAGYKNLKVYKKAYELAMEIYTISSSFPNEEKYALTDQIRRSSRSVCINIGESYRKRCYPKHFTSKMTDADGECTETQIRLDFSKDCRYIPEEKHTKLYTKYKEVGKMLGSMANNHEKFAPRTNCLLLLPTAALKTEIRF